MPETTDTGVEMTNAQGQASTSSVSPCTTAVDHATPNSAGDESVTTGDGDDDRRVVRREALDELLAFGLVGLRVFDHGDDAREGVVAGGGVDADFEVARLVDRAREHLVAVGLVDRDGLAGDGGLIDRAGRRRRPRRRSESSRRV